MPYFDFLPEIGYQDSGTQPKNRVIPPSEWQDIQPPAAQPTDEDEIVREGGSPVPPDVQPPPPVTPQYQKQRQQVTDAVRAGSAESVNRLAGQVNQPQNPHIIDAEAKKQELAGLPPEQHASNIYKDVQRYQAAAPGTGAPTLDEKFIMDPVEQAGTVYNKFLLDHASEEAQLQAAIATQDLPTLQQHQATLEQEILGAKQQIAIASSPRQKLEAQQNLDAFQKQLGENQAQARALQAKIDAVNPQQPQAQEAPDSETPASDYARDLGIDRSHLLASIHETLHNAGIPPEQWDDKVNPMAGLQRIIAATGPEGAKFTDMLNHEYDLANKRAEAREAENKAIMGDFMDERQRLKRLYGELNANPFMHTWPGLMLYFFLGMLAGPRNAAYLLGSRRNHEVIASEIRGIQEDLNLLSGRLRENRIEADKNRSEAVGILLKTQEHAMQAERLGQKQDNWSRNFALRQAAFEQKAAQASKSNPQFDPIYKKMSGDFQRASAMMARAEKVMADPLSSKQDHDQAVSDYQTWRQKTSDLYSLLESKPAAPAPVPLPVMGQ